jgi:nucleoside-diphosphate-sugar epimerase
MKIAVTGATGFIGSHLCDSFLARGHEVTCLVRDPGKLRWIAGLPVRLVTGDLESPEALRDFVAGQDIVVHAAGLTKARSFEELLRANVGGTERLLQTIRRHDPRIRRFLYFSSQAAMGPSAANAPLTEDGAQNPVSQYGRSKSLAEKCMQSFRDALPMTVIRPPAVYGPRDADALTFFRFVSKGIAPVLSHRHLVSAVYVKNLVHGVSLAIERPMGSFRSYFFTDGGERTWGELLRLMGQAMGRKALRVRVPFFAAAAAAGISELWGALHGRPALLNMDKLAEMRPEFNVVSDQRARAELGYLPPFSTEQAIAETVRWYEAEGWL